ncbi:MAG: PAS domain S-box protein [Pseudomonadota bacterium]
MSRGDSTGGDPAEANEQATRQAERRLRAVVNHAPVAFFATDQRGVYICIEGQRFAQGGFRSQDLLGRSVFDVEGSTEESKAMFRRALAGEAVTWRGVSPIGAFECRLVPDLAADGTVAGVMGISYDVTDQAKAAALLAASERRFRRLVEGSADVLTLQRADGTIFYASPSIGPVLGYRPDEQEGHHPTEFLHPDDLQGAGDKFGDLVNRPNVHVTAQYRVRHKDGSWRWMEASAVNLLDDPDIAAVAVNQHDITERLRAEEALRASEENLRLALTAGRMIAFQLDFSSNNLVLSPNAAQLVGATADQLATVKGFFELVHPEDRALLAIALDQVRRGEPLSDDLRFRVVRPDNGRAVWFERRSVLIRDAAGVAAGVRGVLVDITERHWAEEAQLRSAELELENRRVELASRLKSEFLANMSHELRTPLNAIIGFSELMVDGFVAPGSAQFQDFLKDILSSGRHLLQLINDVLDLSKVEAGKIDFRPEPVDLNQLLAEVRAVMRPSAAAKNNDIETVFESSLTDIVIDPARLKQVLCNYVSNALKFAPEGARVFVRVRPEDDQMFRLEVEDTGAGIAPADLARLFVEFQQLEAGAVKTHQGTGLGLALTRRLVEAQGGTVGVRSTVGVGSVFHAILPRRTIAGSGAGAGAGVGAGAGGATRRAGGAFSAGAAPMDPMGAILVVDDDPKALRLMEATLARLGQTAVVRSNGEAGLDAAERLRPMAVVVDLLMSGMDGFEFVRRLRRLPGHELTPIFVWTIKDLSPAERNTLLESAQAVIPKGGSSGAALLMELRLLLPGRPAI